MNTSYLRLSRLLPDSSSETLYVDYEYVEYRRPRPFSRVDLVQISFMFIQE